MSSLAERKVKVRKVVFVSIFTCSLMYNYRNCFVGCCFCCLCQLNCFGFLSDKDLSLRGPKPAPLQASQIASLSIVNEWMSLEYKTVALITFIVYVSLFCWICVTIQFELSLEQRKWMWATWWCGFRDIRDSCTCTVFAPAHTLLSNLIQKHLSTAAPPPAFFSSVSF